METEGIETGKEKKGRIGGQGGEVDPVYQRYHHIDQCQSRSRSRRKEKEGEK